MPLLFCVAIHNALEEVQAKLLPGELYLHSLTTSICSVCPGAHPRYLRRWRTNFSGGQGSDCTMEKRGLGTKKERCLSGCPRWGPVVWSPAGLKILGTPVGSAEFVESAIRDRLEKERDLWQAIPKVHDLQCAWQLLLQCAGPRCHHFLRSVPPSQSRTYAEGHDQGMREVMVTLLKGLPEDGQQQAVGTSWHHCP